ncbi:MAG: ribosome biogenesis protein [Candidatus Aenigmarchaeota archaeon]|nr:ribosome biogenesis protein [Candidatus Aenigmarchaeota archaeon]
MNLLKKCQACERYSLSETCKCGSPAGTPHPPKFSAGDRYAEYRRKAKELNKNG